jgi:hypothetical protein
VDHTDSSVGQLSPDGHYRWDGTQWKPVAQPDYFTDPNGAMKDGVLRSNDLLTITIAPPAIVPLLAAPIPLLGTGIRGGAAGQPICVQGDELPPSIRTPLAYTAPPFVIPGEGMLTIELGADHLGLHTIGGRPVLLQGGLLHVWFRVTMPASHESSSGPIPDPMHEKPGTGQFLITHFDH